MHSLNLLAKLMVLHRRILMVLHRLAIAAVAEVINPPTHAESFKIFLLFLTLSFSLSSCFFLLLTPFRVPAGSPRGGDVTVDAPDMNQPSLPPPFWFCSRVCFCLYSPFNCISSINSPDNSPLSNSVLLVLLLPYWSFQLYISL